MDTELVKRAQQGDERAFEALVLGGHPRLFRIAFGILRDVEAAEDAVQRACLEAWRSLPRLSDRSHYEAWATRFLIAACRAAAAESTSEDTLPVDDTFDPERPDPFGLFIDRDQISRGFRQLSFDDRTILVLRYLAGMDEAQAGIALDIKPTAAGARTASALATLGSALDRDRDPEGDLEPQMEGA